jgi:hypothetical protein
MKIFKIRNLKTGLFSKGGHCPRWSKKGKVWTNIGHVKSHINNIARHVKDIEYWEVVEYELVETTISSMRVQDIINEKLQAEHDKEEARKRQIAAQQELKDKIIRKLSATERKVLGL